MIKANELRIGNIINSEYGILSAHGSMISDIDNGSFIALPIPLTPEILEKCGFEKSGFDWFIHDFYLYHYPLSELFVYKYNYAEREIQHLHQLQNLYFALTGTELEISAL